MKLSNFFLLIWTRLPFIINQSGAGFSSASLRNFPSPILKYRAASSMVSVYFSQMGISFTAMQITSFLLPHIAHPLNVSIGPIGRGAFDWLGRRTSEGQVPSSP